LLVTDPGQVPQAASPFAEVNDIFFGELMTVVLIGALWLASSPASAQEYAPDRSRLYYVAAYGGYVFDCTLEEENPYLVSLTPLTLTDGS
jgi:hypothetical protein